MAKTIGIDLGTTNTVMFHMHTEPEIILSVTHDRLTPSVVGLATSRKLGKTIYVGSVAVNYGNTLGANFLYSTKRLMGRSYDDHEVQRMLPGGDKKVTYQILPSPEGKEDVVKVQLGDDLLNPRDVATLILKHIKEQAQKNLGDEVDSAVITVPAYFNERQKYATREAGRMAGFKVKRVMDEPTAAAIAYGVGQDDDKDKMILVFDLGGGTFDVSIMLSVGGVFPQVNTAGDMWLGGDDFDQLIMNMALKEMEREYEIANASEQLDFVHDLRIKAREVKEALSSQMVAPLILKTPFKDEVGMPITIEQEITRQEFERALAPYVDKAMGIVRLALEGEGLDKDDIDVVLMVGGSSTIPAFQKAVKDFFGAEKVYNQIDPMTCVAQGAAILAKSLSDMECPKCGEPNPLDADKCQKCQSPLMGEESQGARVKNYISRTPMPLGIEIKGGTFVTIIPKNTPYPTDEPFEQEFRTIMPGQTLIKIPVYQGFSEMAQENEFMGNIWFHDLPAGLPQDTPLTISMQLDEDMISTIGCRVRGTDWFRTRSMEYGGWETPVLNEALNTHVEMQKEGLHDSGEMQQHIEGIKKAVEESDEKAAKEHAAALDRIKKERAEGKKAAGGGAGDGWKNGVRNIMAMASNNIDRIRKVLPEDDDKLKKYDQWRKKAEQALNDEITVDPEAIVREGIEVTGAVPLAGDLMMASMLAAMLEESHPSLATRLHQGKEEILTHVDRRDLNSLPAIKKKLDEAMAEALSIIQQSGRNLADSIETMVDRA